MFNKKLTKKATLLKCVRTFFSNMRLFLVSDFFRSWISFAMKTRIEFQIGFNHVFLLERYQIVMNCDQY